MMTTPLPAPIRAYFDAQNAGDVDGMLACFDDLASVHDEHKLYRGRDEVRAWIASTTARYRPAVEVLAVSTKPEGNTSVDTRVSGTFPGSPVVLRYRFELSGAGIRELEIG
jgi:ketosteroid isomerase-like protein